MRSDTIVSPETQCHSPETQCHAGTSQHQTLSYWDRLYRHWTLSCPSQLESTLAFALIRGRLRLQILLGFETENGRLSVNLGIMIGRRLVSVKTDKSSSSLDCTHNFTTAVLCPSPPSPCGTRDAPCSAQSARLTRSLRGGGRGGVVVVVVVGGGGGRRRRQRARERARSERIGGRRDGWMNEGISRVNKKKIPLITPYITTHTWRHSESMPRTEFIKIQTRLRQHKELARASALSHTG